MADVQAARNGSGEPEQPKQGAGGGGFRKRFFATRSFGIVLGLLVAALFTIAMVFTSLPDTIELGVLDLHFSLRPTAAREQVQEGVVIEQRNPAISNDILIVGVDFRSLERFGRWPWPRSVHADLLNSLARIQDQSTRERSIFLDFFFIEPSSDGAQDALLVDALRDNNRVFLETVLTAAPAAGEESLPELFARHDALFRNAGKLSDVTGQVDQLPTFFGLEPPLQPYARATWSYGHANFVSDFDDVFRHAPLVARSSRVLRSIPLADLTADFTLEDERFHRLTWTDRSGNLETLDYPLSDVIIADVRRELLSRGQPASGSGADNPTFNLQVLQDDIIPSITLSLAADYMNVALEDIEVVVGEYIRIPSPQGWDSETGDWGPYRVRRRGAEFNETGEVVRDAEFETLEEVVIPINEFGQMLINYMGPRSSDNPTEPQTFPVRSYAAYAANPPGSIPDTWPRTRALENQIVMVGPFSTGLADDEKTTPYGLMYGVEMHANTLNTIIMDRFLSYAPEWVDIAIVFGLSVAIAFLASRTSTSVTGVGLLVVLVSYFFVANSLFDSRSVLVNYSWPSIAAILSFISVVLYRGQNEEKEKRVLKDRFGTVVDKRVLEQLLESPPNMDGEIRYCTIFFSDIAGFTERSEAMKPQELVSFVNRYLDEFGSMVKHHDGLVDKFIGDAIMGLWGAVADQPEHAYLACKCAVRTMQKLPEWNAEHSPEAPLSVRIGIHTGDVSVGYMGSHDQRQITAMGDGVNLAARLEPLNKAFATSVMISQSTYDACKDRLIVRELDAVRVKGKQKPVLVYELLGLVEDEEADLIPSAAGTPELVGAGN